MIINRKEFLDALNAVKPGLSNQQVIEHSTHFRFNNGSVATFNDEIAVFAPCVADFDCAVVAAPLLAILSKMTEQEIKITEEKDVIKIVGKRRRAEIKKEMAEEILYVPEPEGSWQKIPKGFFSVLGAAALCAGKDESKFLTTCVHISEKFIEATDKLQAIRYDFQTNLPDFLLPASTVNQLKSYKLTEINVGDKWVHFSDGNIRISCRGYFEKYPDLEYILRVGGKLINIPNEIGQIIDRAAVFSGESRNDNLIGITFKDNQFVIRGDGYTGFFEEKKRIKWEGEPVSFYIQPALLQNLTARTNECRMMKNKMIIKCDEYVYVACLAGE